MFLTYKLLSKSFNFKMFFLVSADISQTGRMHPSMLSDQQMVELFFTSADYEASRLQLQGEADDACTWRGVTCTDGHRVEKIYWHDSCVAVKGDINFRMLPPQLRGLNLHNQDLFGQVDTSALPEKMELISVEMCQVSGTLDLGSLPRTLVELHFIENFISAIVSFCDLPESLEYLNIEEANITEKEISIGKLPASKLILRLEGCLFQDVILEDESDNMRVRI